MVESQSRLPEDAVPFAQGDESIEAKLIRLLRSHLTHLGGDFEILPETPLRDLGVDSVVVVDFLVDIETAYDVAFPLSLLTEETFQTIGTVATVLRTLANDGGSHH